MENDEKQKIPFRKDREIEIKSMEIDAVRQVISDADLKTQFTPDERIIISALEELACRPFEISKRIALNRGIKFEQEKYTFPNLQKFLIAYVRKGKALDRRGIGEDVEVMSAYFQAQIERSKEAQKGSVLTK